MELKMRINKAISTSQSLGVFDISDESKVRIIVQEAGASNTLIIRGRLKEQPNFIELYTIVGPVNQVINVFTYEEIQIECTVCEPTTDQIKIYAASFSEAGGSAIDSIDVPSGDPITDFTSLSLESQDGSIVISGDNDLKSIDFSTESSLIPFTQSVSLDWSGTTPTIADAADQLAQRTKSLEINKIDSTEKGSADGVAPLNSLSKIDSIYLPSYVDDVEEYSSLTTFPLIGESSKIYVALDTNKAYRWSGSLYIEISEALVTSVNGDVGDVLIPIDEKVAKAGDVMSGTLSVVVPMTGTTNLGWQGITSQSADSNYNSFYTLDGAGVQVLDPGVSNLETTIYPDYVTLANNDLVAGTATSIVMQSGQISLQENTGIATVPTTPTLPEHVTTKKYVDDQDALKEDVANKSTDGTLASNSDTLYPSQKAVKTYADAITTSVTAIIDSLAYSQIIYVDKNNTRTYTASGTIDKPFKSLKEMYTAITDASASKRYACIIAPGTYTEVSTIRLKGWIDLTAFATDTVIIGVSGGATLKWSNNSPGRVFIKDIGFTSGLEVLNDDPTGTSGLVFDLDNVDAPSLVFRGRGGGLDFIQLRNDTRISSTCTIQSASTTIFDSTNISTLIMNDVGCVVPDSFGSAITASLRSNYIGSVQITATNFDIYTDAWGVIIAGNLSITSNASSYPCYYNYDATSYPLGSINLTGSNPAQLVATSTAEAIRYTPSVSGNWAPAVSSVAPALDQLAQRVQNSETSSVNITAILDDTKEPTGFINRTDSTVSFVDGSRLFTISPVSTSFSFYIKGQKFTKNLPQQITIPNQAGNHYIYFNASGALESTQIFTSDIIERYAFVSVIYWNTDTNTHTYFAEERHGITMDGATHIYLHTTFGSRYLTGLALQDFSVDGNGSLDEHAQFTADQGSIRDEDILLNSNAQSQIPILFRQGQLWRKKEADSFPLIYSGTAGYVGTHGRIPYNEYIAGTWQLTEVSTANYVLVHFFATNDKENPIVGIQGIAEYVNEPQAKAAASSEITSLTGLPFAEFVAIGTVIFQTNSYTNTPDARVVGVNGSNYIDFRGTQLYTPAGTATTHSLLSGLSNDDHVQYHNDSRGDARYYTKSEIDTNLVYKNGTTPFSGNQSMGGFKLTNLANPVSLTDAVNLQTLNSSLGSSNDILEKSFPLYDEETIAVAITDFNFANSTARSFSALVSVRIQAASNLSETFEIRGIQKDSDWFISISSEGDSSKVIFSIDSFGQMHYTSGTYVGFIDGVIKFRAITTSV